MINSGGAEAGAVTVTLSDGQVVGPARTMVGERLSEGLPSVRAVTASETAAPVPLSAASSPVDRFFDQSVAHDDHEPSARATPDGVEPLLDRLTQRYADRITAQVVVPEQPGRYAAMPADLDPRIVTALASRGITRLYTHQEQAWRSVAQGQHTVVVTPTASGKSLCYTLPVLQAVLNDAAKALYLFPTKALSQDQVAELLELNEAGALGVRAYTFDGDTPGDARAAVRTSGDIVVSNPDMLHVGVLPHHTKWAQFFENLRYVVIDEVHTYRGVFGSHLANVLRRLQRICAFYGASPTFIMSSATIANPGELAEQLIGAPVHAITDNGAPSGRKHLLLWNPPVVNPDLGLRASARSQTTLVAKEATRRGLQSIVFANTRLQVEVLTKYLKDAFDADPRRPARIMAYRGGYLPTQRRATEQALRRGEIDCVVSTSALELGVDIGALDVAVLNGYPGSVAATWQRLGRAGRRNQTALGVLIGTSEALDQYIVRNPSFFLDASPEHARIAPDQLLILLDHVRCAAFELPFRDAEQFGGEDLTTLLQYLAEQELVHHEDGQWHWMADSYPANAVSLRSVAEGNFTVIDITDGRQDVIAEVDYADAPLTLYEGAIYLVQAQPWQVERLDWEGRKAFVRSTDADYFTDAIDYTKLKVLDVFGRETATTSVAAHGEVHLVRRVPGYKKIRYYTHENVGYGFIHLPDHEMHTTAAWWQADPTALEAAFSDRWRALDGFLGAAYAMHHVAALLMMSERGDLGRSVGDTDPLAGSWSATIGLDGRGGAATFSGDTLDPATLRTFCPTVYLYDNYPGGVGLSAPLHDLRHEVVRRSRDLVASCTCPHGCPACVGPILASDEARDETSHGVPRRSAKQCALTVLDLLRADAP
jgi:DEAD/DEAH box helicase domain-containing protein